MEESMNKETERYIGLIHALAGALFGVISGLTLGNGQITFLSTLLLGLIASYPLMLISRKVFNLSEKEFTPKEWIGKGFYLFFIVWIIVWTFIYNVR